MGAHGSPRERWDHFSSTFLLSGCNFLGGREYVVVNGEGGLHFGGRSL
jgi:hypothetical protein